MQLPRILISGLEQIVTGFTTATFLQSVVYLTNATLMPQGTLDWRLVAHAAAKEMNLIFSFLRR
jgi:hypothetical protein